ncbi:hypothetical protein [Mesorhizobium sp. 1M-11]|uniref:hypothetical protein n=1 Tax=Mesorhizobium sp. 1M-11 TaxID=1529006 RepID=UPI0006C7378C|nr:hypothetical protein [Mesorhizobium sp. 1M-11]
MTAKPQSYEHIIAFEIAKHGLTLHFLPADVQETIATAVRRVLRREERRNHKHRLGAMLIVCEATGGYERHVLTVGSVAVLELFKWLRDIYQAEFYSGQRPRFSQSRAGGA